MHAAFRDINRLKTKDNPVFGLFSRMSRKFTFDVRLLYSQFGYVPLVAAHSIDGASVGVAEVDKCAFDVGGQCLDTSTV